jgi:uncharacterized protein involved in response to NO
MISPDNPAPATAKREHAEFHPGYIWAALATAIFAGFAIGSYLAILIGYGLPLGAGYASLIQAHGHSQLIGWAGLFIMGTSLHFIPRLASVPLAHPRWLDLIPWFMATGLFLRAFGQPVLSLVQGQPGFVFLGWLVAASGVLEGTGVWLYLLLLLTTLRGTGDVSMHPAFKAVRPFFGMMAACWLLYSGVNIFLLVDMVLQRQVVVQQAWNEFAIQGFIGLVLLPVALAHSVRLFPLYLALPAPTWPVRGTAYTYLLAIGLQLVPTIPPLQRLGYGAMESLSSMGMLLKGGAILWFVWELDLLTRRRPIGRPARFLETGPDRPPTRPGLPDYGEFGRFERLVYSAYVWLVLGAVVEILSGGASLAGYGLPFGTDVVRHIFLLGFITLLIFGVSVRMLPGFMKKKAIARPVLVEATFWLGNVAAVCRVLPLVLPSALFEILPLITPLTRTAFAFSGILGVSAVACLAANLWRTASSST